MMMGIAPFSLCSDMGRLLGLRINVQVFPIRFFRCFRTNLLNSVCLRLDRNFSATCFFI